MKDDYSNVSYLPPKHIIEMVGSPLLPLPPLLLLSVLLLLLLHLLLFDLIFKHYAQMLPNVLNPAYTPLSGSINETTFQLEQTYMYNVLKNKTVLTNKGKKILRMYHMDCNAQKAYADLCNHYATSTAAMIDVIDTYKYISITTKIGDWVTLRSSSCTGLNRFACMKV
jgi:hypothetical protein